jgi:hypothetical protein
MTRQEWVPLNPISMASNQAIKAIQIMIKKLIIEAIKNSKVGVMQTSEIKSCIKFLRHSNSRSFKGKEAIMVLSLRCIRNRSQTFDLLEDRLTSKRSETNK